MRAIRVVIDALKNAGVIRTADATGMHGERFEDAPLLQPAGFDSVPPDGQGIAVAVFADGDSEMPYIIARDDRSARPRGKPKGSVTVYAPDNSGDQFTIEPDAIRIKSAGRPVVQTVGEAVMLHTAGKITANVDIISGGVSLQHHRHDRSGKPIPGDAGDFGGGDGVDPAEGIPAPDGIADAAAFAFMHRQIEESELWSIRHRLGHEPMVDVIDGEGVRIVGSIRHASKTLLFISFSQPVLGQARLI